MSAVSALHQALEAPSYRAAEEAMARWLAAPDFDAVIGALKREPPSLSLDRARKLGVTLEGAALLGLMPRSPALTTAIAELASRVHTGQGVTLQERWGVSSLPFDFGRLKQRMREATVAAAA